MIKTLSRIHVDQNVNSVKGLAAVIGLQTGSLPNVYDDLQRKLLPFKRNCILMEYYHKIIQVVKINF